VGGSAAQEPTQPQPSTLNPPWPFHHTGERQRETEERRGAASYHKQPTRTRRERRREEKKRRERDGARRQVRLSGRGEERRGEANRPTTLALSVIVIVIV